MSNFRVMFSIHAIKSAILQVSKDSGMFVKIKNVGDNRYFQDNITAAEQDTDATYQILAYPTLPTYELSELTQTTFINYIKHSNDSSNLPTQNKVNTVRVPSEVELKCIVHTSNIMDAMNVQEQLIDKFILPKPFSFEYEGTMHRGIYQMTSSPTTEHGYEVLQEESSTSTVQLEFTIKLAMQYYAKVRKRSDGVESGAPYSTFDDIAEHGIEEIAANADLIKTTTQTIKERSGTDAIELSDTQVYTEPPE